MPFDDDERQKHIDYIFSNDTENDTYAFQHLGFQERVIKRVFTDCGCKPASWGRLANACRRATGEVKLNFKWFNSEFSRFPAVLCGKRAPYLHTILLPDLFKKKKNRLVRGILKALNQQEIVLSAPYVFAFSIVQTLFVAHNLNLEPVPDIDLSLDLRFRIAGRPLIIEPAKIAFAKIGSDWLVD